MNLRNCSECGKVFVFVNRNICPDCQDKEEEMFGQARDYIKEHPGATIMEVSEKTGVSEEKIFRFLRDGRIVSSNVNLGLVCESCGAPISSGRACDKCKKEIEKDFRTVAKSINYKTVDKKSYDDKKGMYIADRYKKQ